MNPSLENNRIRIRPTKDTFIFAIYCRFKQMPLTWQLAKIIPCVRTYIWVTICYKYPAQDLGWLWPMLAHWPTPGSPSPPTRSVLTLFISLFSSLSLHIYLSLFLLARSILLSPHRWIGVALFSLSLFIPIYLSIFLVTLSTPPLSLYSALSLFVLTHSYFLSLFRIDTRFKTGNINAPG